MRALTIGQRVVWGRRADFAPDERHRYLPARIVEWMGDSARIELDRQLEDDDDPLAPVLEYSTTLVVRSD